jgi:hypothetical protein
MGREGRRGDRGKLLLPPPSLIYIYVYNIYTEKGVGSRKIGGEYLLFIYINNKCKGGGVLAPLPLRLDERSSPMLSPSTTKNLFSI